jgi:hypothetical protein
VDAPTSWAEEGGEQKEGAGGSGAASTAEEISSKL